MLKLTIKFTPPLSQKQASFERLAQAGYLESIGRLAPETSAVILLALRANAPKRTGEFAAGIKARQRVSKGSIELNFTAPDPLASWILNGTSPHSIDARQGGVLRFVAASGDVVFTRHVDHPGTKANPFAERALSEALPDINSIWSRLGRELTLEIQKAL